MKQRLQIILARAGLASRRKAEELIQQGKVTVDGKVITEMGFKVDPSIQKIKFDGAPLPFQEEKIYLLLNKPKGYVTTLYDPQKRPIVTSLVEGVSSRIFPVGRLDLDTEGALLMTNDGDLAQKILHPSHEVRKTYLAKVAGHPGEKKIAQLTKGIEIDGKRTSPAILKKKSAGKFWTSIEITIHEGRKRQVRRMFEAVGHKVLELKRTAYGKLNLGSLPTGKYRILSKKDLGRIFS